MIPTFRHYAGVAGLPPFRHPGQRIQPGCTWRMVPAGAASEAGEGVVTVADARPILLYLENVLQLLAIGYLLRGMVT